jgi:hypothetical protein
VCAGADDVLSLSGFRFLVHELDGKIISDRVFLSALTQKKRKNLQLSKRSAIAERSFIVCGRGVVTTSFATKFFRGKFEI